MSDSNEIIGNHFVVYYDNDLGDADGLPWCVEFSDGPSTTYRYESMQELLEALMNSNHDWMAKEPA